MNLSLSHGGLLNTILKDDDGRAMYEIRTPSHLLSRGRTAISRISGWGAQEIAQIEWHYYGSTKFHFRGQTVKLGRYMPRKGCMRKRAFVAIDGRFYVWRTGWRGLKLKRDDRSKTHVAQYHPHSGVFSKGRPPHLEVTSHGLAILDEIVVTFVYMERRRKQNETEAAVAAAS